MPGRSRRTTRSDSLFGEIGVRLPLFEDLPPDALQRLAASGLGRGFLTASLRARLRKAGYQDLGLLAQKSPDAIASIRKFGPVRVERVRTFILAELARWLPDAREIHAAEATGERRLGRLRAMPVERLPLHADAIAALGLAGCSCADVAGRSRDELLGTGIVVSCDVDRIVATIARLLGGDGPIACLPVQAALDAPAAEPQTRAAHRAALLAERDREWEAAAPPRD